MCMSVHVCVCVFNSGRHWRGVYLWNASTPGLYLVYDEHDRLYVGDPVCQKFNKI